jgi:hypothetical protein
MTEGTPFACPLCGRQGRTDERSPADVAGLSFRSILCDRPPAGLHDHPFPVRWLEAEASGPGEVEDFRDGFVFVRGPLPEGTPIAEVFGDTDPIRAWIEDHPTERGIRVLIRV